MKPYLPYLGMAILATLCVLMFTSRPADPVRSGFTPDGQRLDEIPKDTPPRYERDRPNSESQYKPGSRSNDYSSKKSSSYDEASSRAKPKMCSAQDKAYHERTGTQCGDAKDRAYHQN
jgi:hypothetical protein